MQHADWTSSENDEIVADYFDMLADDLAGRPYNKSEHRRRLRQKIARSSGSIDFKHRNISAALVGLGEDWIPGYKPAYNYQAALEDAVASWLRSNPEWLERMRPRPSDQHLSGGHLDDAAHIWIGPAPTLSNQPPPDELERTMVTARKFDVAERDQRNRALGRAGEQRALAHEKAVLRASGRHDLADRVRWVSNEDGDGAGYDIASFTPRGDNRLIEVKTTNGWERTPFHISRNELAVAAERNREWCLLRLYRFSREPRAFEITPPLEAHVSLMPTSFQASFR